ncbi:hypothetical protein HYFRA_00000279 [Hymenoscyphus fraxineus]|uniref:Uncharacterized protein n=1 Tax=Hymenoscyphus fraxineus TaxID=746836 RepID=A0A9N9PXS0_9HELO|nr:hypothetical protein HYFRA_00000279 [Hymenoscyphus fraxineus]
MSNIKTNAVVTTAMRMSNSTSERDFGWMSIAFGAERTDADAEADADADALITLDCEPGSFWQRNKREEGEAEAGGEERQER